MVDWKVIFLNPSRRRHETTNGLKSSKINIILVYTFLFGWSFENKNKNRNTGEWEKFMSFWWYRTQKLRVLIGCSYHLTVI